MITDDMLREAAKEALRRQTEALEREMPEDFHFEPSPRFQRKMARLLRRARHPRLARLPRQAAAIFLVLLTGVSVWLAADTQARAAFFGWVRDVYETAFVYRFREMPEQTGAASCRPAVIPAGYTEYRVLETASGVTVLYADEAGRLLRFTCVTDPGEAQWQVEAAGGSVKSVAVQGRAAELVTFPDGETASVLVWTSADGTAHQLSGLLPPDTLLAIAESVGPMEKP